MNLEINIKVPLGAAGVSITQPGVTAQTAPDQIQSVPHDAFPPALDPGRSIPWGEPQRQAPNGDYVVPAEAAPPSLVEMGIAFDPPPNYGPPSLQELSASAGLAPGNGGLTSGHGGTPLGLEGVDFPAAALSVFEPPPPPELELEAQATSEQHVPPLPEDLIRQMRANKGASAKPRKD